MISERYNYYLTVAAENDIDNTFEYISVELSNRDAAYNLADKLEEKLGEICTTPKLGKIVQNEFLRRTDVRLIHINNYLLYYVVDEKKKRIIVLRFIFGGRNQNSIFKDI